MIDFIVTCVMIITAYRIGYIRGTSPDKEMNFGRIQDQIEIANRDKMTMQLERDLARNETETWRRRYLNLAGEKVGS